jgi:hypothetical protein
MMDFRGGLLDVRLFNYRRLTPLPSLLSRTLALAPDGHLDQNLALTSQLILDLAPFADPMYLADLKDMQPRFGATGRVKELRPTAMVYDVSRFLVDKADLRAEEVAAAIYEGDDTALALNPQLWYVNQVLSEMGPLSRDAMSPTDRADRLRAMAARACDVLEEAKRRAEADAACSGASVRLLSGINKIYFCYQSLEKVQLTEERSAAEVRETHIQGEHVTTQAEANAVLAARSQAEKVLEEAADNTEKHAAALECAFESALKEAAQLVRCVSGISDDWKTEQLWFGQVKSFKGSAEQGLATARDKKLSPAQRVRGLWAVAHAGASVGMARNKDPIDSPFATIPVVGPICAYTYDLMLLEPDARRNIDVPGWAKGDWPAERVDEMAQLVEDYGALGSKGSFTSGRRFTSVSERFLTVAAEAKKRKAPTGGGRLPAH